MQRTVPAERGSATTDHAETLARAVIRRVEGLRTRSAAVLRTKMYEAFAGAGVDVALLVGEAREAEVFRRRVTLSRVKSRRQRIKELLANGGFKTLLVKKHAKEKRPPPSDAEIAAKRAELEAKLASGPKRLAEIERAIAEVAKRRGSFASAPTPERRHQAGEDPRIIRTQPHAGASSPRAHKFDAPLERTMHILSADEYDAAEKLRWAHQRRQSRARISDIYGQKRGNAFTLSHATDKEQRAIEEQFARADRMWNFFWRRIPRGLKGAVRALVLQEPGPGEDSCPTPIEWGMRYGGTRDKRRAQGVADGALKATCMMLVEINLAFAHWRKEEDEKAQAARAKLANVDPGRKRNGKWELVFRPAEREVR